MKKITYLFLVTLLTVNCENESVTQPEEQACDNGTFVVTAADEVLKLRTQTEVNEFGELCYSKIEGNLYIQDHFTTSEADKIIDLSPLSSLREIQGDLRIRVGELDNLTGLENIVQVDGLKISESPYLQNLNGLNGLNKIGRNVYRESTFWPGALYIRDCSNLLSFEGLDNLKSIDQLIVFRNQSLLSFNGLQNLIEVKGQSYGPDEELFDITIGFDCFDAPCGPLMYQLKDYCALQNLFANGNYESDEFYIGENLSFYPSVQDIIDGNCSQ